MKSKNDNTDFNKAQEIFSPASRECLCEEPNCAKCLGSNCSDVDCEIHTRQAKLKYKKQLLNNIKLRITGLKSQGQTVSSKHPLIRLVSQLDTSIKELEWIESGLHIDYKYGYGPNGSVLKRIWGKLSLFLFVLMIIAVPILSILGMYFLFTIIF